MAEITPPLWSQNGGYPAAVDRRLFSALTDDEGVAREDALQVSHPGGLNVDVSGGEAFVDGTEAADQGRYLVSNDGTVTLALAAADPANPRYDLIVARVYDAAYSGATNTWALEVVQGTAASSPIEPAVPANSLVLARARINGGSATVDELTDRRKLAPYKAGSPIGTVTFHAAGSPPAGWLECDGSAVSRTLYAPLFAVIGTTYGAGDGSTTFGLPDLAGRFPIGSGTRGTDTYTEGDTGGSARVTLATSELPGHTHTGPSHTHAAPSHTHGSGSLSAGSAGSHTHSLSINSNGGHAHQAGGTYWNNDAVGTNDVNHTHRWGQGSANISTQPSPAILDATGYDLTTGDGSHAHSGSATSNGSHGHSISGSTSSASGGNTGSGGTGNTGSTGGGSAHENRPPYLALLPIIRAA